MNKEKDTLKEIEKEFKPKTLNVNEAHKNHIIVTDVYSWEDFRNAIKKTIELTEKQKDAEWREKIDEWRNKIIELPNKYSHFYKMVEELKGEKRE